MPIIDEIKENSILQACMHGARAVLERELKIRNIVFGTEETVRKQIERESGDVKYPYGYIQLTSLSVTRDRMNNKATRRHGMVNGIDTVSRSSIAKAFLFPVKLNADFHYVVGDPIQLMKSLETLAILTMTGSLTCRLTLGGDTAINFDVSITLPDDMSIPTAESGGSTNPGGNDITLGIVIDAFAGFVRNVATVNSTTPEMVFNVEYQPQLAELEGEADEGQATE